MKKLKVVLCFLLASQAFSFELKKIEFSQKNEISQIEIHLDKEGANVEKYHLKDDKQIIIDLKNVKATQKALRSFDTSEFSGTVVFVSPYKRPGTNDVRLAIQLRDNARSILDKEGSVIKLSVENRFGAFTKLKMDEAKNRANGTIADLQGTNRSVPRSGKIEDILENLTQSGNKKYVGKKISLNFRGVPIDEILNTIAETSGFNMIIDEDVLKVKDMNLNLTNIPWDQALDIIMDINKLVAKRSGNILQISTLSKATSERELELRAKELSKKQEPLLTKIYPISFAKIEDMEKIIKDYITKDRGSISMDSRTNSLILKDTEENIERIKKILDLLDTATPQILIESKIVEVTEGFSKELGLRNGLNFGYDPVGFKGDSHANVGGSVDAGDATRFGGPGLSFSSAPGTTNASGGVSTLLGFTVSRFSRLFDLNFTLQLMETESKAKIVSSPRVITENKKAATITSEDTTNFPESSVDADTNTISTTFKPIKADLNLTVTPQVTNEGSIALKVDVSKTDIGTSPATNIPPDTNKRSIKTNVLVDNGSTVVLGGIYKMSSSLTTSGIPVLKDIPLVGWLFRSAYNPSVSKTEMVIFLTPRIINQEEAGLVDREDSLI